MESASGATETAAFTRALASLKRRGSNLLVVGATSDDTHLDACDRLLGGDAGDRRRLFVLADGAIGAADASVCDETSTVVEYVSKTRSATATTATPAVDARRRVVTLPQLGEAIHEIIESFRADAGELAPAELRVCFDSLRPLLEEHDEREVFRFVHALTSDIRAANGMAHYHLPVAFDSPTVRTLAPLFDAVIEVRSGSDGPQQRWHLRDEDLTTDWVGL